MSKPKSHHPKYHSIEVAFCEVDEKPDMDNPDHWADMAGNPCALGGEVFKELEELEEGAPRGEAVVCLYVRRFKVPEEWGDGDET